MSTPTLAETQALFWKLITAPEGVAKGLDDLDAPERRLAHSLVRARPPLSPVERWDIYANMYFFRIRDCLKEDYVAVAGVVGDDNFHNLITDYLLAHPPSHFSLRYAGEYLPQFIREHELSEHRPYLSDLARLEYAIVDSFDAVDSTPLTADELKSVQPQDWPNLRLRPSPSLRLLDLSWPVGDSWSAVKDGRGVCEIEPANTHVRVWRKGLRVFHKTIPPSEHVALTTLASGGSFGDVCEVLTDAQAAASMLRAWVMDEVLCSVDRRC